MIKPLPFFFLLFTVFLATESKSQDLKDRLIDFKYLKSEGAIPEDFTKLASEKFADDKKNLLKHNDKRSTKKKKELFKLESNFEIDKMLLSGKVLYNDPVSKYINTIAGNLLKNSPELRQKLRFYVTKSTAVNAYANDNGIIFVNLGLVAQLQNEAELAFILAHEIMHYVKEHNINFYLDLVSFNKKSDLYKRASTDDKIFAKNFRSKEIETEADKEGFTEFYLNSGYSLDVIDGVFDVLQYAYLPFDEIPFTASFLETPHMKFPETYFLKDVNPINSDENFDDSKSTHPNIKKRKEYLGEMVSDNRKVTGNKFIQPKELFTQVRDLARFEVIRQYIIKREYQKALYNSLIVLKDHPNNKFLETSVAACLYSMSKYKSETKDKEVFPDFKKIEGQSQQAFHFFSKMKGKELSVSALAYAWNLRAKHPKDPYLTSIVDDMFSDVTGKHNLSLSDFSREPRTEKEPEKKEEAPDTAKLSKYQKINKNKDENEKTDNFIRYALVDLLKNKEFEAKFKDQLALQKAKPGNKSKSEEIEDKKEKEAQAKLAKREADLNNKYGQALGVDKILLAQPFVLKVDERKKNQLQHVKSEISRQQFNEKIIENARIAKLDVEIFDAKTFEDTDFEKFNDLAFINDLLTERINNNEVKMIPFTSKDAGELMDNYGAKHVGLTGVITTREPKEVLAAVVITALLWPVAVYTVPYMLSSPSNIKYFHVLYNIETGNFELNISNEDNKSDTRDFLNANIYDTFHQIKTKRK